MIFLHQSVVTVGNVIFPVLCPFLSEFFHYTSQLVLVPVLTQGGQQSSVAETLRPLLDPLCASDLVAVLQGALTVMREQKPFLLRSSWYLSAFPCRAEDLYSMPSQRQALPKQGNSSSCPHLLHTALSEKPQCTLGSQQSCYQLTLFSVQDQQIPRQFA